MPFDTTQTLEPNPHVKIIFVGLFILAPAANRSCQVFVHNASPDHNFLIEVRRKRPGKLDQLIMRAPGPITPTSADPSRTDGILIRTAGLPISDKGIKAFTGNTTNEGSSINDSFNLTTLLNGSPGIVDPIGSLPGILIDHGVLYTAETVNVRAQISDQYGHRDLTKVPTLIAANIKLNPNDPAQKVNVTWRQQSRDVDVNLEGSRDYTYEIYLINEPLYEPENPQVPPHDELNEYFNLLPDVPRDRKLSLRFLDPIPRRGSTRTPCMSVLLGT